MAFRDDQTGMGFVYVMRNRDPARYYSEFKIGLTKDPEARRLQLSGTSSAYSFKFERLWAVSNMALAESIAHRMLQCQSINPSREFYHIVPLHMHEGVFDCIHYEPDEDELDACLQSLLDRIEKKFDEHANELRWCEVNPSKEGLRSYSRELKAWQERKPGAPSPFLRFQGILF